MPITQIGLTDEALKTLQQIYPNGNIIFQSIRIEGGCQVTKNDFGGVSISAPNSAFAVGSDNTVTNINQIQDFKELTKKLLEEIEKSDIPRDKKEEVSHTINTATEQVNSGKPNKNLLGGLLGSLVPFIDTINKSPALIETFTKWKDFLGTIIGM